MLSGKCLQDPVDLTFSIQAVQIRVGLELADMTLMALASITGAADWLLIVIPSTLATQVR